jgi:predicted membrane-bound spermidine synthase
MLRIFIVTTIIFFVPSCVLGTISPVVVRLTLKNLDNAGNVIGKIYALSTLGAIIGTFVTGFFLISWMGTQTIVLLVGAILIFVAILSGSWLQKKVSIAIFVIMSVIVACPALWAAKGLLHKISLGGNDIIIAKRAITLQLNSQKQQVPMKKPGWKP